MYTPIINSLQLSNCILILISSDPTEFSFTPSEQMQQTLFIQLQWGVCFSSVSRLLACVVTVSRNKDIRGLVLLSIIFHACPLLFSFRLFDAEKRL